MRNLEYGPDSHVGEVPIGVHLARHQPYEGLGHGVFADAT